MLSRPGAERNIKTTVYPTVPTLVWVDREIQREYHKG
jgi:hypothetical protein